MSAAARGVLTVMICLVPACREPSRYYVITMLRATIGGLARHVLIRSQSEGLFRRFRAGDQGTERVDKYNA